MKNRGEFFFEGCNLFSNCEAALPLVESWVGHSWLFGFGVCAGSGELCESYFLVRFLQAVLILVSYLFPAGAGVEHSPSRSSNVIV